MKRAAIVLVVREDERILVVWNRTYKGWCLPGGKVEEKEVELHAAARELKEEVDLQVATQDLVWLAIGPSVVESERLVTMYLARFVIGVPRAVEPDTVIAWHTLDEVMASRPFGAYYARHLHAGVKHFKPTRLMP